MLKFLALERILLRTAYKMLSIPSMLSKYMRAERPLVYRCLLLLGAVLLAVVGVAENVSDGSARKILFIGDSFTSSQGGIYSHFLKLAQTDSDHASITTGHVVLSGATLKHLWDLGDAVKEIDTDAYDVVVLQDDIPEINVDYFRHYARMFVEEVRRHHARPVLYMAWAYQRLGWISMTEIAQAHRALAEELHVDVAPVGLAWERARREQPSLDLLAPDREHPSPSGMYLATCVMYATIFKKNPTGLAYSPSELTPSDAAFLQRVAWETVKSGWM